MLFCCPPLRRMQRRYAAPVEWFDGQHEALISQELFDRCQEVRRNRATHRQATPKYVPYLLRGLVYCYRCCTSQPQEVPFPPRFRQNALSGARRTPTPLLPLPRERPRSRLFSSCRQGRQHRRAGSQCLEAPQTAGRMAQKHHASDERDSGRAKP